MELVRKQANVASFRLIPISLVHHPAALSGATLAVHGLKELRLK